MFFQLLFLQNETFFLSVDNHCSGNITKEITLCVNCYSVDTFIIPCSFSGRHYCNQTDYCHCVYSSGATRAGHTRARQFQCLSLLSPYILLSKSTMIQFCMKYLANKFLQRTPLHLTSQLIFRVLTYLYARLFYKRTYTFLEIGSEICLSSP